MRESITEKALHERDTAEPLEMHEVDGAQASAEGSLKCEFGKTTIVTSMGWVPLGRDGWEIRLLWMIVAERPGQRTRWWPSCSR